MPTYQRRYYLRFETTAGDCLLVHTLQPFYVIRLFLPGSLDETALIIGECRDIECAPASQVATFITDYFAGLQTVPPPSEWLLLEQLTPKERIILRTVATIPYGHTRSYGEVAQVAGFDGGARFAGNTLAKNPFPVIYPCHRVIRADGSLGGFGAGVSLKKQMLDLENIIASPV